MMWNMRATATTSPMIDAQTSALEKCTFGNQLEILHMFVATFYLKGLTMLKRETILLGYPVMMTSS